jgi:acetyl-CoA acetyltransferase
VTWESKGKVAVVGVGLSRMVRNAEEPVGPVALQTCLEAIEDAGLSPSEVDGLATLPYEGEGADRVDGIHMVSPMYVMDHLTPAPDIKWFSNIGHPPSFPASVIEAANALASGACTYVLVWQSNHHARTRRHTVSGMRIRETAGAEGASQFTYPYGCGSTFQNHALQYARYMALYGARREDLATLAVTQRRNANKNPSAYFYETPLTFEEYMNSRMIADPLCLFDCDIPVQGAAAVVLTTAERARDLKNPPAYVAGYGENTARRPTAILYQLEDYMNNNLVQNIWAMSGLGPNDVDVAQLYDGYSPSVIYWLEVAGFCGRGEGYQFIQDGRIELDGELPINTSGGQLSEGALGYGKLVEAVRQVTGRAGPRQVKDVHVSLLTEGSPMNKGAGLLFTDEP